MTRFTDRVTRDLHQIADRSTPSSTAWDSIQTRIESQTDQPTMEVIMLSPDRNNSPKRGWMLAAAAGTVILIGGIVFATTRSDDNDTVPADAPQATAPVDAPEATAPAEPAPDAEADPAPAPDAGVEPAPDATPAVEDAPPAAVPGTVHRHVLLRGRRPVDIAQQFRRRREGVVAGYGRVRGADGRDRSGHVADLPHFPTSSSASASSSSTARSTGWAREPCRSSSSGDSSREHSSSRMPSSRVAPATSRGRTDRRSSSRTRWPWRPARPARTRGTSPCHRRDHPSR